MTSYLLTGATGFVGRRLTRMILDRGDTVTALARPSPRTRFLRDLGVTVVHGDLADGAGLAEAVRSADRVIHLAALVKAARTADFWTVNRDGTACLARALSALPHPPRLVVCSSLAAAGPAAVTASGPVSFYGASKLAGEEAAREHAGRIPAIVLRPGIVYGPGEPALLPALVPMIRRGIVIKAGTGPRRYCMLYVDDLCAALLAAAERGATMSPGDPGTGVYPVCDGRSYDWSDICAAVAHALGRREPTLVPVPMGVVHALAGLAELGGRIGRRAAAFNRDKARELRHPAWTCPEAGITLAARELGVSPATSLRDGLAASVLRWQPERQRVPDVPPGSRGKEGRDRE
ncbi:NAD-dependent epimerase/dehydratase family protein [Nonomuraea sp. NPDC002799]